jgi:hypothetical protein
MNLRKNPAIVYLICFLVVIMPGAFVLFGPELKSKSKEHSCDQKFNILLIGSLPFLFFCIMKIVDYVFDK